MSGSGTTHPSQGISTIRVVGWPGVVETEQGEDPNITAYTAVNGQQLEFQPVGLGILRLMAFNAHGPGSNLVLIVRAPAGVCVVVERATSEG